MLWLSFVILFFFLTKTLIGDGRGDLTRGPMRGVVWSGDGRLCVSKATSERATGVVGRKGRGEGLWTGVVVGVHQRWVERYTQ